MGILDELASALNNVAGNISSNLSEQNQNLQFCRRMNQMALSGMDQNNPETVRQFENVLVEVGADKTPNTALGRLYPIVKSRCALLDEPVADPSCPSICLLERSGCAECLARRKKINAALAYAENAELYKESIKNAQNSKPSAPSKCPLCGAPAAAGTTECEYCGTKFSAPASASVDAVFIPPENVSPEMAAYDLIYENSMKNMEIAMSEEYINMMTDFAVVSNAETLMMTGISVPREQIRNGILSSINLQKIKMSQADIYQMASEYNMPVHVYLRALYEGSGNVKTAAVFRAEKQQQAEQELRERQRQQEREMREKADAQRRKANEEYWARQRELYRPPQYSGGASSSSCCGSCVHYMAGSNECAYNKYTHPSSASDYCGNYRSR